MSFPALPNIDGGVGRFGTALNEAQLDEEPYRYSALADVLPEGMCVGVCTLPIAPLVFDDCNGVCDRHCEKRCFSTPRLQSRLPACALFAAAMQRPEIAWAFGDVGGFPQSRRSLRSRRRGGRECASDFSRMATRRTHGAELSEYSGSGTRSGRYAGCCSCAGARVR